MGWLFSNPLADMAGPQFLFFYAIFASAVVVGAFFFADMQDMTGDMTTPATPSDVDPYELSYLRGGVNDVIRTAIYALRQKGLIEVAKKGRIRATGADPAVYELTEIERRVYEATLPAPTIKRLFKGQLPRGIESLCGHYRQRLSAQQLLAPPEVLHAARWALAIGLVLLVALAAYKMAAAISHGKSNLVFLFFEAAVSCSVLLVFFQKRTEGNASKRGKAFLSQIQLAYSGHVAAALGGGADRGLGAALSGSALFMVGLFGFSILKGTPDAALAQEFAKSSGAGGGCGSDGGGGDGGGGGGCGGCGGG